jgi:cytochrome P450
MSRDEIAGECLLIMISGSDTTATTLRHLIFNLLRKPDAFTKLQRQIDVAYDTCHLAKPVPKYTEIEKKVPFLQACIMETLRLASPVAAAMGRIVSEPIVAGNLIIPEGAEVGMNPWVVHRHEETWGPDFEEFKPERWEDGDFLELEKKMLAFGGGGRVCLGKDVAMLEIAKVACELIRRFEMEIVGPPKGKSYVEQRWNTGTWSEKGFWMRFARRDVPEWDTVA